MLPAGATSSSFVFTGDRLAELAVLRNRRSQDGASAGDFVVAECGRQEDDLADGQSFVIHPQLAIKAGENMKRTAVASAGQLPGHSQFLDVELRALNWQRSGGGFKVGEVNGCQRLRDVQFPTAIPIIDPVRRVRVLLDFDDNQAGVYRMESSRRNKETFAGMNREAVKTFLKRCAALRDRLFKLLARHAAPQAGNKMGIGRGIEDVPHFGFRFAAELRGDGGRWMNLQGESFPGVKQFDEERETFRAPAICAEQFVAVVGDELAEGMAGQWAVGDDALFLVAVTDFPLSPICRLVGIALP